MKNKKFNLLLIIFATVLFFLIVALFVNKSLENDSRLVLVLLGEKEIKAEVAISPKDQAKGLSLRDNLDEDRGMLFLYDNSVPGFWMKGMNFPIDIIWIKNGIIVGIEDSVEPDFGNKIYYPPEPIDMVLEVNAGFASRNNLKTGDFVTFQNLGKY